MAGPGILFQAPGQFEPVDAGNVQVRDDNLRHPLERAFESLEAVMCLVDTKPGLGDLPVVGGPVGIGSIVVVTAKMPAGPGS